MQSLLKSKVLSPILLLALFFLILTLVKVRNSTLAVDKEITNQKNKIDEVEKSIADLQKSKEYLKTDSYIEKQARLRLNYKKPDENVVFVYSDSGSRISKDKQEIKRGFIFPENWLKWWNFLISKDSEK